MTRTIGTIDELRAAMDGSVLVPGDPAYDEARTLWNADVARRPSVIARCASATDVAAALRFAQESGLEVAVRGGGHSAYGASSCDNGLMIHLGGLNQVSVDPAARRARCGGGATLADLDAATQEHGLAVPAGRDQPHRRRRAHPRRRVRLADPQLGLRSTTWSPPRSSWPTAGSSVPAPTSTRTCSGRCAGAAATSAWSPSSSSGCTRSARCPRRHVLLGSRSGRRGAAARARLPAPRCPATPVDDRRPERATRAVRAGAVPPPARARPHSSPGSAAPRSTPHLSPRSAPRCPRCSSSSPRCPTPRCSR